MRKSVKKLLSVLLIVTTLITTTSIALTASAATSWPSLSSSSYCEFTAGSNINVYRDSSFKKRGTAYPAKSYSAYVESGDVCRIYKINSSYVYLAYPTSSGYKEGYIKRSALFNVSSPSEAVTSKAQVTTYKTAGGSSYGYVAKGDKVYKVGTSGNYTRVIYQARSGNRAYKLAYVTSANYNSKIKLSSTPAPSPSPSSSTAFDYPMKNAYCTWRTPGNNMSWSSYTNNSSSRDYHLGIDIWGNGGNVYSTADGKVVALSKSTRGANGRYIIIQHTINGKTIYSFYAHLESIAVTEGQRVSRGTKIGVAGGSGNGYNNYYGKHLHFAIVDSLWSGGGYYGYATEFSGDKIKYDRVTYYNPVFVIKNDRLP